MGELKTCLIVDDKETNRMVASGMVEILGFDVQEASNAYDALPYVVKGDIDVIMLDWHMPEMDGMEFLNFIRESHQGKKMTVLIYSAIEEGDCSINTALKNGANGFISKPITIDKVKQKFTEVGLFD